MTPDAVTMMEKIMPDVLGEYQKEIQTFKATIRKITHRVRLLDESIDPK